MVFWGVHPIYALSSKNAHATNLTLIRSWVRGSTAVKAALLPLSDQHSISFTMNVTITYSRSNDERLKNWINPINATNFFQSVSWMHVASWGCHTFSIDLEQCRLSTVMWYVSVFEVWHVLLTLVVKVKQPYCILLQSFFFYFTIKCYVLDLWPMESSGSRISDCEMYILYIKLLDMPDIFFTALILVLHRINYCTFTKIITVLTQNILVPSSTPCLFCGKLVYLNGKHTNIYRNLLIWCQWIYATLNTWQQYPLIGCCIVER